MKVLVLSDNKICYGDAMDSILCQGFQAATVRIAESVGSAFIAMETQSTDILLLDVRVEGTLPSLPALRFRWPATYMVAFGVDTPGQDSHCQRSKMDRIFYKQATAGDLLHVLKDYGSKAHAARTLRQSDGLQHPLRRSCYRHASDRSLDCLSKDSRTRRSPGAWR
jgi:hypothetical protein